MQFIWLFASTVKAVDFFFCLVSFAYTSADFIYKDYKTHVQVQVRSTLRLIFHQFLVLIILFARKTITVHKQPDQKIGFFCHLTFLFYNCRTRKILFSGSSKRPSIVLVGLTILLCLNWHPFFINKSFVFYKF